MSLREVQKRFLADVADTATESAFESPGMRAYARNYHGKLVEALRDTYARTLLWLGDDAFDAEARRYIDASPPVSWTLDAYGDGFVALLDARFPDDPDVGELAWLDLALRRAFSGRSADTLGPASLVADDWDRVEFVFVPTLQARRMRSNAVVIWKALDDETLPPASTVLPVEGAVRVWREGLSPRFSSMGADEYACLDLALAGGSFGEICELLLRWHGAGRVATEAGHLLRAWVSDGLVTALRQG
jgi:hypothetical protein